MSGKSDYKKVKSCWNQNEIKGTTRAAIKQEETDFKSEKKTKYKKKARKTPGKHADHKHIYEVVLVKHPDKENKYHHYTVSKRCCMCGRSDASFWKQQRGVNSPYTIYKPELMNGRVCYRQMTDDEILKKYSDLRIIEESEMK